jgi:type I restriction enzyme R subunit
VGYKSSKTRVCVTVGMMTTGYDCPDILNLCLMRPIFSPTDFIQIKGRGTRKYTFSYKDADNEQIKAEKETFKLFDFFANCEYFEEKYNYDEVLKLPTKSGTGEGSGEGIIMEKVSIFNPDPLKTFSEKAVGLAGMKVDWKFFEKFEHVVKSDPVVKQKYEQGDVKGAEEYVKTKIFDKPEDYFNLDKLRKAVKADRRITLKEFIEKIFGGINKFKTKDELLEEEFEKFISIYKPESKYVPYIKNYLKAYITDPEIRDIVETKEYSRFATNPKITMKDFRDLNGWREVVPEYVKDYVSINAFM